MSLDDVVNYRMFEAVARKALRAGIRDGSRKMGLSDLDEEATSLAYALASVARTRIGDVIVERDLRPWPQDGER